MTYSVAWSSPARRDMARLPPKIASVILTFVDERLADNPQRHSKALQGELEQLRSARSGDYRVLFRTDQKEQRLLVVRVDHRAHVYR